MDFRRVDALPPYAFAEVERLKLELRRGGEDVIDLGFGNPDVAPPEVAVEKLREAALLPRNHRYSSSRGLPKLREAICDLYRDRFGVELDPETEATLALGAKEGLVHLLWVLLGPGDVALVPSPSYPIHLFAPGFAGAAVARVPVGPDVDFVAGVEEAWLASQPRPRVLLCSFPHNPTTACVELDTLQRLVDFARERELVLVHDFAYADLAFDGYRPPSIFECAGAREVAVELYSLTKGFSLAGWRIAFLLGRSDVVGALARLKSYLDYGSFQPLQIAATVALREARERPAEVAAIYGGRRNALCDGLDRIGWDVPRPRATMFVWARIPTGEPSQEFALRLLREAHVAVSPGSGFGSDGEGYVRFALVENEQRIAQAVRGIRRTLA
jgi:alanine-synthesizing transaminase